MEYLMGFQEPEYRKFMTPDVAEIFEKSGDTFSAVTDSGEVLVSGGVRKPWEGRGELWAVFSKVNYSIALHKIIKKFTEEAKVKRLEMIVNYENVMGHKLAKALGFKVETEKLTAYRPDGGDVTMYVRIN